MIKKSSAKFRAKVKAATVQFERGCPGILTAHGVIVTVGHIFRPILREHPKLSEAYSENFTTADGRSLFAKPLCFDIASDLAVLGLFYSGLPKRLADFFEETEGVPIASATQTFRKNFAVEIFTPSGIVSGTASIDDLYRTKLSMRPARTLRKGESGSPVFADGQLVGVVSTGEDDRVSDAVFVTNCLPFWINAQKTITKLK